MSEWIRTSNNLPKEDTEVLVYSNREVCISYYGLGVFAEPYGGYPLNNVTHWMPLPSPPSL